MVQDELLDVLKTGLAVSPASETEITIVATEEQALRYTANRIIQNIATDDWSIWFRVVDRGRVGVAETNDLSVKGLRLAADQAWTSAQAQPCTVDYRLPGPEQNCSEMITGDAGDAVSLEEMLAAGLGVLKAAGWAGAGNLSWKTLRIGIANTNGICCYHEEPRYAFNCIASVDTASGYAGRWGHRLHLDEVRQTTQEAIEWGNRDTRQIILEPGEYEVVLSPYATADLLWLLQYMGFSARAFLEERSFLIGHLQQLIMAEQISIWDDAADRRGLYWSFDWEGVPRRKVNIIQKGVALSPVYDSWTGRLLGRPSTGHAIPAIYFGSGPYPAHLVMEPGGASVAELLASVEQGIYINRFHYTNVVDPRQALATGMTRDGTYYIRNGKICGKIPNMRFSDGLLAALSGSVAVGNDIRLVHDGDTGFLVPSLKLGRLRFTS
ncbi:MAG TPA: TldD/PmbA family protein [Bacillota bacterium]|nr:TldD/PmbA family protein [Bacillota bacterium]